MTIKIEGYSEGDSSVGIGSAEFSVDTGMEELSEDDRKFLIEGIVRDIWELHDNGDLAFNFSDEIQDEDFGYTRRMTWRLSQEILSNQRKQRILNSLD